MAEGSCRLFPNLEMKWQKVVVGFFPNLEMKWHKVVVAYFQICK